MTPGQVLTKFITDWDGLTKTESADFADDLLAALKAEGLFIGPLVATPEMEEVGETTIANLDPVTGRYHNAGTVWSRMAEEWQRGEGA